MKNKESIGLCVAEDAINSDSGNSFTLLAHSMPMRIGQFGDPQFIKTYEVNMAYMTGAKEGWYAIVNEDLELGWVVNYPTEVFKYLWYWRNYAGGMGYPWYGRCFNAGLEPCTSFGNAGVTESQENGTARRFRGNESIKVTGDRKTIPMFLSLGSTLLTS